MLIDPRASVHATTAILPVTILNLPAKFIEPALRNMDVHFRLGPILSTTITTRNENEPNDKVSILIPQPSEKNGTWSWMQPNGPTYWNTYPILPTNSDAVLIIAQFKAAMEQYKDKHYGWNGSETTWTTSD